MVDGNEVLVLATAIATMVGAISFMMKTMTRVIHDLSKAIIQGLDRLNDNIVAMKRELEELRKEIEFLAKDLRRECLSVERLMEKTSIQYGCDKNDDQGG